MLFRSTNMFSVMLIPCFEMVYCLPFESVIRMDAYEYVCSNLSNNCFRTGFFCSISLLDVTFIPFPFTFQVFVVLIDYLSIENGVIFVNSFHVSGKVCTVRRKKDLAEFIHSTKSFSSFINNIACFI